MQINLEILTRPEWGALLLPKNVGVLFNKYLRSPRGLQERAVIRQQSHDLQEKTLRTAYKNFKALPTDHNLQTAFHTFTTEQATWLDKDALFHALCKLYKNDYAPNWQGGEFTAIDQTLLSTVEDGQKNQRAERRHQIEQDQADEINFYKFCQFLAKRQKLEAIDFAKNIQVEGLSEPLKLGFMSDRQVGFSNADSWAYQDLFLSDWAMGVPPDYFSKTGQAWNFPVIDPEQIFDANTGLVDINKPGSQLLYTLFKKIFEENPGGVRIDHIIGLIDPWVYPTGAKTTAGGSRLYSSPEHPALRKYARVPLEAINNYENLPGKKLIQKDSEKRVKADYLEQHSEVVNVYASLLLLRRISN